MEEISNVSQVTNSPLGRGLCCLLSGHCARLHMRSRAEGHRIPEHRDSGCGDVEGHLLSMPRTPSKKFFLRLPFGPSGELRCTLCKYSDLRADLRAGQKLRLTEGAMRRLPRQPKCQGPGNPSVRGPK